MATRTDTPDTPETPRVGRTARSARLRRVLLTTAAAAMLVVPTACGYAAAADRIPTGGSGQASRSAAPVADQEDQDAAGTGDAAGAAEDAAGTDDAAADAQQQARGGQNRADQADANARNGQQNGGQAAAEEAQGDEQAAGEDAQAADQGGGEKINGLDVLARDCSKSNLPPHDGFQKGDRCVSTEFGEVGDAAQNPSLLITKFPQQVQANQPFSIDVTTSNLKRDRFLGAAAGGYYLESSLLDENGIQRGHFHTACRMISLDEAPAAGDKPAFFVATQDNKGGAGESTVTIDVTGLPKGTAQCSSWAGDGSHRIPMMERADQTPAFDSVRIRVV
ncbi:hypothetical protein GCM10017577_03470 [Pseudonocardia halophobica]|uniref:Uncharacterized protein n=1 Tax=Pseudonocardia halophobica TaxID=29401 RepID=A0A9W6NUD9_9PSEU|nr:hypothetical protein [Pseudonocardia halophobica]GLL09207.1 hypothetical protein GCM10017577_03470 [Pseudonocardia halophobica]